MTTMKFKGINLTKKRMVNNLLRYYSLAMPNEIVEGLDWYRDANHFCKKLANRFGVTVEVAAGVLSALSPQCGFEQNKKFAITALSEPRRRIISTRERTIKAQKIMGLNEPDSIHRALSINEDGACKTKAFFMNIVKPYESTTCTIDRHAIGCLLQRPSQVEALPSRLCDLSPKQYQWFVECYQEAAGSVGILGHQFQAILWTVYRRLRELREHKEVVVEGGYQGMDIESF